MDRMRVMIKEEFMMIVLTETDQEMMVPVCFMSPHHPPDPHCNQETGNYEDM